MHSGSIGLHLRKDHKRSIVAGGSRAQEVRPSRPGHSSHCVSTFDAGQGKFHPSAPERLLADPISIGMIATKSLPTCLPCHAMSWKHLLPANFKNRTTYELIAISDSAHAFVQQDDPDTTKAEEDKGLAYYKGRPEFFKNVVRTFARVSNNMAQGATNVAEDTKNQLINTLTEQHQDALSIDLTLKFYNSYRKISDEFFPTLDPEKDREKPIRGEYRRVEQSRQILVSGGRRDDDEGDEGDSAFTIGALTDGSIYLRTKNRFHSIPKDMTLGHRQNDATMSALPQSKLCDANDVLT